MVDIYLDARKEQLSDLKNIFTQLENGLHTHELVANDPDRYTNFNRL